MDVAALRDRVAKLTTRGGTDMEVGFKGGIGLFGRARRHARLQQAALDRLMGSFGTKCPAAPSTAGPPQPPHVPHRRSRTVPPPNRFFPHFNSLFFYF
jgi:hypothetical protein